MKTGSFGEYAAHARVSAPYVSKLRRQGRLVTVMVDGRERVNFDATYRLIANTADQARSRSGENAKPGRGPAIEQPDPPDLPESTALPVPAGADSVFRKAQAQEKVFQARKAEVEYRRLIGELVDKSAAERAVFDEFRTLRDHAFRAPERAAARAIGLAEVREIEHVIVEELRKAFEGWEAAMQERMASTVKAARA